MIDNSLIQNLNAMLNDTKTHVEEKNICNYILDNIQHLHSVSITHLADVCGTSPTKITRLCSKLGLSGFSELKLRIRDLSNTITIDGGQVNVVKEIKENENEFFEKYLEIKLASAKIAHEYFINKNLTKTINNIMNAKKVYLFAFNLSYNISRNFCQRLRWLGINAISECDYISILTYINTISKDDVVILISISGKNELIKSLAERLHSNTYLIGIVDSSCSFLESFNDTFLINTNENQLWTINSIRAQTTIQYLDYIYANIVKLK